MTLYYNISVNPWVIGVLEKGKITGSFGFHIQEYDTTSVIIFLGQSGVYTTGITSGLSFNIFVVGA